MKDKLPKTKSRSVKSTPSPINRALYDATSADKVPALINDLERPAKQNTSESNSPTNLPDLQYLQNKIEPKRLEIAEAALNAELQLAQCRAALPAVDAYCMEGQRNRRSTVTFEAENLEQVMKSARRNWELAGLVHPGPVPMEYLLGRPLPPLYTGLALDETCEWANLISNRKL